MFKLLSFLLLLFPITAQALDFTRLGGTFAMDGYIEKGDYDKFLNTLQKWEHPPTIFWINSSGGSVSEAMKIGNFVRNSFITLWTGDKCYSSCFLIYAAAFSRKATGEVGIHRVYFEPKEYGKLDVLEARKAYKLLEKETIKYLERIDVPNFIVEEMFKTSSSELKIYTSEQANDTFGLKAPFYDEWLSARCGSLLISEKEMLESISYLKAYVASLEILQDKSIPKAPEFENNIKENFEKSKLALSLKAKNPRAFEEYKQLLSKRSKCIEKSEDNQIWKSFFKFKSKHKLNEAINE